MTLRFFLLLSLLVLLPRAHACKCLVPELCRTYWDSSTAAFVKARVIRVFPSISPFGNTRIVIRVLRNYKGCGRKGRVVLRTPAQSATCGVTLVKGAVYVLPLKRMRRPRLILCDFFKLVSMLTPAEKRFLNTRNICCKGQCHCADGTSPVSCFRQPCDGLETCAEAAKCVDNYCGGCWAEFFTSTGMQVCKPPAFINEV